MIQPFSYQSECRTALDTARSEGLRRALVVMASGLGKTVTAALDVEAWLASQGGRMLYLCHQNEIIDQSRMKFESVIGSKYSYGSYHGLEKNMRNVDCVFASFQTFRGAIGTLFKPGDFDYVVVDESHHTHAASYLKVVSYLQPKFLLGLTATPDRADGLDIRSVYGQEVYYLPLEEALARDLLTPVDYRLMTDDLSLDSIKNISPDDLTPQDLNSAVFSKRTDEEIIAQINQHAGELDDPRIIIFTHSVDHANALGQILPGAAPIHSRVGKNERSIRLELFRAGLIKVAIAVDCFNEGIDIPEANVLAFLRSTSSTRIFFQQLGRGLRRQVGKKKVIALDFVSNCDRLAMLKDLADTVSNRSKVLGKADREAFTLAFDEKTRTVLELLKQVRAKRVADVPELMADFSDRNRISPSFLPARSPKQVWWHCSACHYEWIMSPRSRMAGKGCPECANKVTEDNNLLKYPYLVRQFSDRNELRPVQVHRDSKELFWWICRVCGYEYQTSARGRTRRKDSCPQCASVVPQLKSNLAFNYPKLAAEYSHLNISSPEMIDAKSIRVRHWICSECGHTWQASARARVNGQMGCPICTAKVATKESNVVVSHPHLADEYSSRNRKPVETILANTDEKLWWVCSDCGRYWEASGRERLSGARCSHCTVSTPTLV